MEQLVRLTEQALAGTEIDWGHPWFLLSRGIAECRANRPQKAIDFIRKGTDQFKTAPPVYQALARLFLSLAYQQMNDNKTARKELAEATQLIDRQMAEADSGDMGDGWLDWVFCQVVRREAELRIENKAARSKN